MAPKLKVYKSGCGQAGRQALDKAGAPAYVTQGDVYVVATSKVKAAAHGQVLHVGHYLGSDWTEATGDDVDAIVAAGYLTTDGEAVVLRNNTVADYVAHTTVPEDYGTGWIHWTRVGRLARAWPAGPAPVGAPVTVFVGPDEPVPARPAPTPATPTRFYAVVELAPGTSAGERIALEQHPSVTLVHDGVDLAYGTVVRVEQR